MNQYEKDNREKYTETEKRAAILLYLEGCGFRRISRILQGIYNIKVCYQLVIQWIKKAGLKLEKDLLKTSEPTRKEIPVLEMDELFTYIQKKQIKSEYGLLLTEIGCVLLDLRSVTQVPKR
jgi:transposase-like protein